MLVRFDRRAKALIRRAARHRGLSVSDYVRSRIVALAQQDVEEAASGVLRLGRDDQVALWRALQHPRVPAAVQKALGRRVRSVM